MARITKAELESAGALAEPSEHNYRCSSCGLHDRSRNPFRNFVGPDQGGTAFVTGPLFEIDNPSHSALIRELAEGKPYHIVSCTLCDTGNMAKPPQLRHYRLCSPFVRRQLIDLSPSLIVCLGGEAATAVLNVTGPIKEQLGIHHTLGDVPVIVTYSVLGALSDKQMIPLEAMRRHIKGGKKLPAFPGWKKVK